MSGMGWESEVRKVEYQQQIRGVRYQSSFSWAFKLESEPFDPNQPLSGPLNSQSLANFLLIEQILPAIKPV